MNGVARIVVRREHFWGRPRGVSGGGAPPRSPENFRKFSKKFLRKLLKRIIFEYFTKNLTNNALIFHEKMRLEEKHKW